MTPMDKDTIEGIVQDAIGDAVAFIESEISEDRIKSQRYFDGEVDIGEEAGRSAVVATKVRDTIRSVKPSLMRVFLSTDKPVEYRPSNQQDVPLAAQATKYAHYVFQENGGYRVINDAFHDALVKKAGIVKVYWDTYTESKVHEASNLTSMELAVLVNDESVEVLEQTTEIEAQLDEMGMEISPAVYSLKFAVNQDKGKMCIESMPPEEFFIDRNAKSIEDCYVCGQRTEMRVSDLVTMGYDFDKVSELSGIGSSDTYSEAEDIERRGYSQQEEDENSVDPSMKQVAVTEAYMKMDMEGSGIARLYRFVCGGNDFQVLDYELWDEVPFASFEIDPEPHTFFGRSLADLLMEDQDASTAMLRGLLDNVALVNNPRTAFNPKVVNTEDMMNNEIAGLVRADDVNQIRELAVPFVAGQTLAAITYMDEVVETKTGVSKASMGLDPNALQNTTATAAQLTAQQGAGQIEVMARNLAEGGMRRMFKLMLKLFIENSDEEQMMQMNGEFTPVDPRSWDASMDVSVNVGLGIGKDEQKLQTLMMAAQKQDALIQGYGPDNGFVTLQQARDTLADILALGGVRNADRYFQPITPELEQQILQKHQMQQQQKAQQSDPNQAYLQAEQMKAQGRMQEAQMKAQLDAQRQQAQFTHDTTKLRMDDDRARDKMSQDLYIKNAEIAAKNGTQVDIARIKAEQAAPRY